MEVAMRDLGGVGLALAAGLAVASCVSAPAYQPPAVVVAPAFRALGDSTAERAAVPGPRADSGRASGTGAMRPGAVAVPGSPLAGGGSGDSTLLPRGAMSAEAPQTPFWLELGDSTLVQLVNEALRGSPDVQVAESRLRAARASRRLAALDLAPTVTASAGVTRQRLSIAQLPGLSVQPPEQDLWDGGFDASWELDIFGRVSRTVRAQGALVASAEADMHDVQLSLAAEVARTYLELRGAQAELAVALRNAENQSRTVALTEERLAAGRGTAFDTERAKAALELTRAAIPTIEARIAGSRNRLAVLLGRSPDALSPALTTPAELPPLPEVVRVGSPQQLVRRRPDVLRAERELAARTMLVGAAKAEYLPRLTIGGSVGYTATTFDALGDRGTPRYLVGPVLSWPFLDLGRVKARVDGAEAQAAEARARYTSAVLAALEEAETAIATYDRARARLASLREAARASERAAELAQLRFQEGVADFLQVLDAQRTLLEAESQLAAGRTAAAVSLVALYKAVGGAWPPEPR
jgi:multidrug efflux system outer membrane protein